MKKYLSIIIVFYMSVVNLHGYSINGNNDSTVSINIKAKDYRNQTFEFYFPSRVTYQVNLDSLGQGEIVLPLKQALFVEFGTIDSVFLTLLLEPGYRLVFITGGASHGFYGKGASSNNYLMKAQEVLNQANKSLNEIGKNPDKYNWFANICYANENKLHQYNKELKDSIAASINDLLLKYTRSFFLYKKQLFLLNFDQNEIDSLKLEEKLGLTEKSIFSDTSLIKTHCRDFLTFLSYNCDQVIGVPLYSKHPDTNTYPIFLFNEIRKSAKYSYPIKEYLLFNNLFTQLDLHGYTVILDSIAQELLISFPENKYHSILKAKLQKFNTLIEGKKAPEFSGITGDNKVYSLKDFKGKVIFMDIWATWCGPCKEELPFTHKLQNTFKDNKEVIVLYISIDQQIDKWKNFLTNNRNLKGIHISIVEKSFKDSYKITAIPRYILIDKNGNIINAFCDKPSSDMIEEEIRKAL